MAPFALLFVCHFVVLLAIVRWRGLYSAEGLGLAFVGLLVASDAVALVVMSQLDAPTANYALGRMEQELVPTLVHIVALILFALGLGLIDPHGERVGRRLTGTQRRAIAVVGLALLLIGLGMKFLGMYLYGIRSFGDYLSELYVYDFRPRSFSFLDQGVGIAVLGCVLTALGNEGNRVRQALALVGGLAISMLLSTSKSGVSQLVLLFYVLARLLSPLTLRAWSRSSVIVTLVVVFVAGLGIKTQIKYHGLTLVRSAPAEVVAVAAGTIGRRFGSEGLYHAYCNIVDRILENPARALHGAATVGIFAGAVPRAAWVAVGQDKPSHPFYARGDLVNPDYHVDVFSNDAPSLVGAAFADAGFLSLVPTMLLGGVVLALIRLFWLSPHRDVFGLIGYGYFAASYAQSFAESGFLNILYYAAWGLSIAFICHGIHTVYHLWSRAVEPSRPLAPHPAPAG